MMVDKNFSVQDPYRALGLAIVCRAAQDYTSALKTMDKIESQSSNRQRTPDELKRWDTANHIRTECLTFFRSWWFELLCDIDPDALIEGLNRRKFKNLNAYIGINEDE